ASKAALSARGRADQQSKNHGARAVVFLFCVITARSTTTALEGNFDHAMLDLLISLSTSRSKPTRPAAPPSSVMNTRFFPGGPQQPAPYAGSDARNVLP